MQLPKFDSKRMDRLKLKICKEPGCGKEFWGHPISKFCEFHRVLANRKNRRRKKIYIDDNMTFKHVFTEPQTVMFHCGCCGMPYPVRVLPKQWVYPKYCADHRSAYRRQNYERLHAV